MRKAKAVTLLYTRQLLTYRRRDRDVTATWDPARRCLGVVLDLHGRETLVLFDTLIEQDREELTDGVYAKSGEPEPEPLNILRSIR